MNVVDCGDMTVKTRTRNGKVEVYYRVCLDEQDYMEFLGGCRFLGLMHRDVLSFFNELGLDIRQKEVMR